VLAAYLVRSRKEDESVQAQIVQCRKEIAQQRARYQAAKRDFRLLEKLRARRLASWNTEADREMERLASELHLSRLAREMGEKKADG
jgi:hypothetical protein